MFPDNIKYVFRPFIFILLIYINTGWTYSGDEESVEIKGVYNNADNPWLLKKKKKKNSNFYNVYF